MKISPINLDQLFKIVKAGLYVGVSALLAYLISALVSNPGLFGPLTPVINVVLVTLKQLFTDPSKT